MADSLEQAAMKALVARDEAFQKWYMLQSKMPYRSPEEIAGMGWHAAMDYVDGLLRSALHQGDCRCEREGLDKRFCSAGCDIPHVDGRLSIEQKDAGDGKDAARYRWLRKGNDYERGAPMVVFYEEDSDTGARPYWSLAEGALDAAIDAAIATRQGTK